MKLTTPAIVLHAQKYGDTSLIVKMFTEVDGVKSYLLRGVLAAKKGNSRAAYFQPLMLLEIVATHKQSGALNSISDVKVWHPYTSLHTDFLKNSLVFFLAEILYAVLREEEGNPPLFMFLVTLLQWLDVHDDVANFHIYFMLHLSKYLGFYPDEILEGATVFDLSEGQFRYKSTAVDIIEEEQLEIFKLMLLANLPELHRIKMNKANRLALLEKMLIFYQLHLEGFRKPKSLKVLTGLMS